MKYQLGDRVIMLHSDEEGEIVDFINDKMVTIDVNGVKFPVHIDQIDFPYFKRFSQKSKPEKKAPVRIEQLKKEKPSAKYGVTNGVWLVFLPVFDKDIFDDDVVENFKIYLVNQTTDHLLFDYTLKYAGNPDFSLKNEILPYTDFYLHDVPFENVNDSPRFEFDFSLKIPDKKRATHFESVLKTKPKQIFQKVEEIKSKQLAHFSFELYSEYPEREEEPGMDLSGLSKSGFRVYDAAKIRSHLESPRTVIDLHIEKLADQWKNLSPYAILDLQLKTFEKYYELALAHHQSQLIVVHGVGTGKLRDEIHDILRLKKEVKSFVNQYHPSFGYGATEIYFQY
jgi:hypothetical protein